MSNASYVTPENTDMGQHLTRGLHLRVVHPWILSTAVCCFICVHYADEHFWISTVIELIRGDFAAEFTIVYFLLKVCVYRFLYIFFPTRITNVIGFIIKVRKVGHISVYWLYWQVYHFIKWFWNFFFKEHVLKTTLMKKNLLHCLISNTYTSTYLANSLMHNYFIQ